ncbi:hypothetical protein HWV62_32469 [Athelia sp. TMB]|nr:hypothetical protein HWV62_32469 [Athelia sp. TMB]
MGARSDPGVYPGRDNASRSARRGVEERPYDPTADDTLDNNGSVRSHPGAEQNQYIVSPSIQVKPEFTSLTRTNEPTQPLTCIVIIELPGKRVPSHVPGPAMPEPYHHRNNNGHDSFNGRTVSRQASIISESHQSNHQQSNHPQSSSYQDQYSTSPVDTEFSSNVHGYPDQEKDTPFVAIVEDLRSRIIDWKGHPLSGLGPLRMYNLLCVRRDSLVREFYVYLFKEALICVVEEKKRSLGRLLSNASDKDADDGLAPVVVQGKGVLRLKGRIYVRHIKQVTATSSAGEMSLTIDMEDEKLDSFILIFNDKGMLEIWRQEIQSLVNMFHGQKPKTQESLDYERGPSLEEFGGNSKAARILSGSTATTTSTADSLLNSARSTRSSSTSHGSVVPRQNSTKLQPLGEDDECSNYETALPLVTPHLSMGPSNSLSPLPHSALDLILVISVPPPSATPSTAGLKVRVIKTTLDFILASLGQKDRLSLVTFEVGPGGKVRKTPFLCPGRAQSRGRLTKFIDEIGDREGVHGVEDEFLVKGSKDEKTDVVTAVNHGLDNVLQRKNRNPISGMLLVSDAADSTRRAQMDLVLARAEAANVAIHSFGYGRSHDPASLWLMSNHTSGTYTFVKDWYDLRDCIAGCVGGLMSIGLMNMKLHMKIVDGNRFRIRKVSGGPSSIVSSDGHDVDVDIGELRYGERKEMLIELELDNSDLTERNYHRGLHSSPNATDQFVQSMGLDSLSMGDADLVDGMMDHMIDEVPVFEVGGSFFDPAAGKQISRLAHPVLLTVTLLPPSPRSQATTSDPVIVRRRMELLASDMITRALVLVSRKNFPQALKIMGETKRILHTVLQTISRSLPAPNANGTMARNRKEILTLSAVRAMQGILQDLQLLTEALEENKELFAHDQRNFGAQQAMILRDQKSWSGRSATERLFWTTDHSIELVGRSTDWIARD